MADSLLLPQSTQHGSNSQRQQQQQQQQQKQDHQISAFGESNVSQTCKEISLGKQILMTSIFFGISCATEFDSLYAIVSMQYFGLPVYLVSMPGLVSGTISVFLIPLLGRFSDKGRNPMRRKLMIQGMSSLCFPTGFIILAVCSWVKIMELESKVNDITFSETNNKTCPSLLETMGPLNVTNNVTTMNFTTQVDSPIPVTAFLSMVVVLLIDIGYDITTAIARASILEVIPPGLTNRFLSMASLMTSSAGILVCLIGISDVPSILGPFLGIDGYGATLILLSIIFGLVSVVTSFAVIRITWTIYYKERIDMNTEREPLIQGKNIHTKETNSTWSDSFIKSRGTKNRNAHKTMNGNITPPFSPIVSYESKANSYWKENEWLTAGLDTSISESHSLLSSSDSTDLSHEQPYPSLIYDHGILSTNEVSIRDENKALRKYDYFSESGNKIRNQNNEIPHEDGIEHEAAISKTYKTRPSISGLFSNFDDEVLGSSRLSRCLEGQRDNKWNSLFNTRIIVCLMTCFFCYASDIAVVVYQTNTLTLEVFRGDPHALPGTPGRIRYEKGIRTSSFGLLAAFLSFVLTSVASIKLIDRIGALRLMILSNLLLAAIFSVYCVLPQIVLYFGAMLVFGVTKSVCYTVPYALGIIYICNDASHTGKTLPTSEPSPHSIAQMTSWVGITVPLSYILISSIMGPLMDATGSAWPPVYFSVAMAIVSAITGTILSFL